MTMGTSPTSNEIQKHIPEARKVGLSPNKENCLIYFNESPLQMTKNVFYFILKAFRSQDV